MRKDRILAPVALVLLMISCASSRQASMEPSERPLALDTASQREDRSVLAQSERMQAGSMSLLEVGVWQHVRSGDQTYCFSPASLGYALAMAALGAGGTTQEELSRLRVPAIPPRDSETTFLEVANAVWAREDLKLTPSYERELHDALQASGRSVPMIGDPAQAARIVNQWASDHTHRRISEIVSPGDLSGVELLLTNAIYFQGTWWYPFDTKRTRPEPFRSTQGERSVEMMHLTSRRISYAQSPFGAIIALPYDQPDYFMVVYLPYMAPDANTVPRPTVNLRMLKDLYHQLSKGREVIVSLPKFKIRSRLSLMELLPQLGMRTAITASADFSPMTVQPNHMRVGKVIQVAEIEVSERQTIASAVTAVMECTSVRTPPPPVEFRADRPFIYMICHRDVENVLFFGQYNGD